LSCGRLSIYFYLIAAFLVLFCQAATAENQRCALALVLAVDVSGSIDSDEYDLQMSGLAEAFRSEDIANAIETVGGIYVTVMHWSGNGQQFQIVPWTRLTNRAGLQVFAAEIESRSRAYDHYATAIGEALGFANRLFQKLPARCRRRVIDISGDGRSNEGWSPHLIRDAVILGGATINGLAILANDPELKSYFKKHVIGGNGSFVMSADRFADYPDAVRRKLLREISSGPVAINDKYRKSSEWRAELPDGSPKANPGLVFIP